MADRDALQDRIGRETFDLVIIGGGITGAGIANDAALRGLSVALLEKGDFASGASGRSSRLVHGGLRYLRHRQIRLVRESLRERYYLLRLAPHLVRRIPFILPFFEESRDSALLLRAGLIGYGLLAGRQRIGGHQAYSKEDLARKEPQLRTAGLRSGLSYFDAATDDARLTLAVVRSAQQHGALALNYAEAVGFERTGSRIVGVHYRDALTGREGTVRARVVVSAAGPWTDDVRRLAEAAATMRPTTGIHVVVSRDRLATNSIVLFGSDGRVLFAVPHGEHTYLGTTDTDFSGDPSSARADREDVAYVLEAANGLFDAELTEADVVATWAGVRPLLREEGTPSGVSRDYAIMDGPQGLVTIVGGKLTTFRAMAERLVDHVVEREGSSFSRRPAACRTRREPLFGGDIENFERYAKAAISRLRDDRGLGEEIAKRLLDVYGTEHQAVLANAGASEELLQPLAPGVPVLAAEAAYAVEHEMALTLEDFMSRRSGLMLFGGGDDAAVSAARVMGDALAWSEDEVEGQLASYRARVAEMFSFKGDSQAASAAKKTSTTTSN